MTAFPALESTATRKINNYPRRRTKTLLSAVRGRDGDRDVDLLDLGRFLGTFGHRRCDPHFLEYLDFNGNDRVGLIDLFAFVGRLGTHLNP